MSVTQPYLGPPPAGPPMGQPTGPRHGVGHGDDTAHLGPGWSAGADQAAHQQWQEEQRRRQEQQWEAELYWRRVRGEMASRLELFNMRHAEHAWRLRNSFGIAPTALVLVYVDPVPRLEVKVAGKLLPDTDQVADPNRVLYDLCGLARDVAAAGQDPRTEMSENPDEMSPQAAYHGVALSMLDTPAAAWRDVRTRVGGSLAIPGRLLILLADTTMLLADRLEHHQPEHYQVAATNRLESSWGGLGRRWRYTPDLAQLDDPDTRPLWLRLHELHTILAGANHGH